MRKGLLSKALHFRLVGVQVSGQRGVCDLCLTPCPRQSSSRLYLKRASSMHSDWPSQLVMQEQPQSGECRVAGAPKDRSVLTLPILLDIYCRAFQVERHTYQYLRTLCIALSSNICHKTSSRFRFRVRLPQYTPFFLHPKTTTTATRCS